MLACGGGSHGGLANGHGVGTLDHVAFNEGIVQDHVAHILDLGDQLCLRELIDAVDVVLGNAMDADNGEADLIHHICPFPGIEFGH